MKQQEQFVAQDARNFTTLYIRRVNTAHPAKKNAKNKYKMSVT